MQELIATLSIVLVVVWMRWAKNLAAERNRNEKAWMLLAFCLGPFAIITLYFLSPLPSSGPERPSALARLEDNPKQWRN
jgi:hypothetical protein